MRKNDPQTKCVKWADTTRCSEPQSITACAVGVFYRGIFLRADSGAPPTSPSFTDVIHEEEEEEEEERSSEDSPPAGWQWVRRASQEEEPPADFSPKARRIAARAEALLCATATRRRKRRRRSDPRRTHPLRAGSGYGVPRRTVELVTHLAYRARRHS